jgi:hypothetical protein
MPVEKSHGAYKFDNAQDAQQSIQNLIQNDGAFIPTGLQMIKNLRNVTNGQNPTAINSVGASEFMQALQAISSLFSSSGKKNPTANNYSPCLIPPDQRTAQEQYDCEIQQALDAALSMANTSNDQSNSFVAPVVNSAANSAAYSQAILDISNTVITEIESNSAIANSFANSLQSDLAVDLLANSAWVASLKTEMGL